MSFVEWMFGKSTGSQPSKIVMRSPARGKDHGRTEMPRDVDLNAVEYIPLPPSPPSWKLDGRDEFHREFNNPDIKAVFQAGWECKYAKVIKLAASLTPAQRTGQIGKVIANAYRHVVQKPIKANQLETAAALALEMLEIVPAYSEGVDKRRYNRILDKLDKAKIKHDYQRVEAPSTQSKPLFTLPVGSDLSLIRVESLADSGRQNPVSDAIAFTSDGVLYLEKQGVPKHASGEGGALLKFDHRGNKVAERAINHDAYRVGYSPTRTFCAIMDSVGNLYIYNSSLDRVADRNLQNDRRIKEHFRTTDTSYWGEFHHQVRVVDVNADGAMHLFTLADEAWCCTASGDTAWGVRMPLNEGWVRAVGRSDRIGPGPEIEAALRTLGLALPVTPSAIKQRYRELALRHHPDRNPGDPSAHQRMQGINDAFKVLTGVDPAMIDFEVEASDVTYFRRKAPDHVIEVGPMKLEIWGPHGSAQDWIYGGAFASNGAGAFLATYSGKVVEVSDSGAPVRVYDVGTVPSEIVDAGGYLYFLTPTRLYIIEGHDRLMALIDVFRQGRLLVTTEGFGLLDSKRFQWFTPSGNKLTEIITRDPIRAVYDSDDGAVLETRKHRAVVRGLRLFGSPKHT